MHQGQKGKVYRSHEPAKDGTVRACIEPRPTQVSYKWQQGLQAVNRASNNLVRRSTNEPLSAEKEDTTPQTIHQVSAIV